MIRNIIEGYATVKHLNIRKEGPDDDKILAIDIKLAECLCDLSLLAQLLGAANEEEIKQSFWSDDGEPRYVGLEPMGSWSSIDGCLVVIPGIENHAGAKLKKFKIQIRDEFKATVDFSVTIKAPSAHTTSKLANTVLDSIHVAISREQTELDFQPADGCDPATGEVLETET